MCGLMKHGGPDDEGVYVDAEAGLALGHRRLSLIDLSQLGHQPMHYHSRYTISFNGEIYNYQELRAGLIALGYGFCSQSDTEVILAGFAAWGTGVFARLNGMFALAIWDAQEKLLYLARDASGIKPLYYGIRPQGLAFSSEVRGFKAVPFLQEENPHWPVYLMAYGHLPEPVTLLKHVEPLRKGHYLCYDARTGNHHTTAFKQFSYSSVIHDREEAIHEIQAYLDRAVRLHLVADAPLGVFLSGGLDSGIIALLAHEHIGKQLNTLSLYFQEKDFSEKRYQDLLLQQLDCHSNQHLLTQQEFQRNLPDIIAAMDQPSSDGINTWFISKVARESGLKAVLSGIGGDELYGGYPSFSRISKVNLLEKTPQRLLQLGKYSGLKSLRRLGYLGLPGAHGKYLFLRGQFIPYEIARQLQMQEADVWQVLSAQASTDISGLSDYDQAGWMETNLFMQNQLLRDGDVMSMAHGIEIRVPFLEQEFVDLSLRISPALKKAGRPKQLLIDSFRQRLPRPVWNRPKMGFGMPFKSWLSQDPFIKSLVRPDDRAYLRFREGHMHWSQFLSWVLIRQRLGAAPGRSLAPVRPLIKKTPVAKGKKVMLLTLTSFSVTGGIEKVSKVAGKALHELCSANGGSLRVVSMYDKSTDLDEKYIPKQAFRGFGINRMSFALNTIRAGRKQDVIILSHINLLPVGYAIKLLSPRTQLILIAHGIEVWMAFGGRKRRMLRACDRILTVSRFTRDKLIELNDLPGCRVEVLNNCLDPYLQEPLTSEKDGLLQARYGLQPGDKVLMTLTRMAAREKYKGYDVVIRSLRQLKHTHDNLKYLVVGKYDAAEKARLDALITEMGVGDRVIFSGYVPDEELAAHFSLADVYIMPSEKEGFGIVFIEAMYYNKPVIAGNKDGSVDALLDGKLGLLVDPHSQQEVEEAIQKALNGGDAHKPDRQMLMDNFSYEKYKERWGEVIGDW